MNIEERALSGENMADNDINASPIHASSSLQSTHKQIRSRKPGFIKHSAQGMVEFALVLPILLLLIFGIIEGGRLMFTYISLASAGREAARYGAGIGNVGGGPNIFNDCNGIRSAAVRIGRFGGVTGPAVHIFKDAGPGTTVTEYCNPSATTTFTKGDRILINIDVNYSVIAPLVLIPDLTLHTESAHTILMGAEVESVDPPPPPSTSLVCDMTPYTISETNPLGPVDVVTITNNSGTDATIKNILLIWEGTGGPVLQSISSLTPGPGPGVSSINASAPYYTKSLNWSFPASGSSSFTITFSKILKSRVIIRLTLTGVNNCAFGN